ncbi:fungal alpha-L-arabinofuranosidase, putative [Talaromyces stipitatus ATCC 10500]|uniref:Alpha-L-arabinofuranosidase n=1 Tax=Talaromyces stipitatus (strain ATCC 10500 / CBS 375.48 / QM 6759 / NRRL 1006) TaxID=441959 RepID=B8LTT5_TALSN|nr:fungal alpha-L-arabinofuranosidase, putative [Talaromyces stipitatus ATCC 10500]EED23677.1 fungal alpha-L-arabinofuranosidase, putative [Talaromyces stipitatus ATCC 10500]
MFPRLSPESARILALGLVASSSLVAATGPCDIYASGGTPCVAAHSTTRALYASYSGALYQVKRGSDGATTTISPLSAGGVANAAAQDSFCANTTCVITIIYDQSGRGNHLTQAPPGGFNGPESNGYDNLASAIGAPVTLNGQKAYGVFISPGTGYRNNRASGTATGDAAEGMYAVLDGTHYNGQCCFDYGNAETSSTDTGNGHMEAIYYGDSTFWGTGSGSGPWIMADLENGLFSGSSPKQNTGDPSISYRFVTAAVKGEPNHWAIRGGNSASGSLSTFYDGARPSVSGYNPMAKEGAIILGIGGDNSNGAQGTFYEGVMTSGYPSDATENAVQANIVAAKYATTSLASGPALNVTTPGYTTRYIAHNDTTVNTEVVSSSSSSTLKKEASWTVRTGLGNSACFSFESVDTPGSFIRHYNFELMLDANDGTKQFHEDATFCPQSGLNGKGSSLRSWSYPTRYFRHYNNVLYAASNGGVQTFDATASFNNDVSFLISTGFV